VVEQKKAEKADQNSQRWTEYSEPEWDVPASVGDGFGFYLGHSPGFFISCLPLVETPERAACPG
jgi:hypothetical protein